LKRVKGAFGLRPASPFQDKSRAFSLLPQRSQRNLSSRVHDSSGGREVSASSTTTDGDDESLSLTQSASALFLGDHLAKLIEMA
jgi:hypothetical protein